MFYIKQFFLILRENLLKGIFFFFITLAFVIVLGNWRFIKEKTFDLYPDYMKGPSFFALISSDQDYQNIQRKLISLPGISGVIVLEKEGIKRQTDKLLENFHLNEENLGVFNFVVLEVMFDKNISERGQELIRNYLLKLAGENNITLGKTNLPPNRDGIKAILDFVDSSGKVTIALFFAICWVFALILLKKEVKRTSYLIEQFQRKSSVELKIVLSGILAIYFFSTSLLFISPSTEWFNVTVIGFFFLAVILIIGGKKTWGN